MSGSNTQTAPTATMSIASGAAAAGPVSYGYYPQEGSRALTAQYNWTSQTGYVEDLSQVTAKGIETTIQSVFVDNSENTLPVVILVNGTGQKLQVPASAQGVFPLFFSGAPGFQIYVPATLAGAVTRCIFLNVPAQTAAGIWPVSVAGGGFSYQSAPPHLAGGAQAGGLVDAYGSLFVDTEGNAPVYSAAGFITAAAAQTDVVAIFGNAGKIIRVHEFSISSAAANPYSLVVRSNGNTGGAPAVITPAPHDSNSAAPQAVTISYGSSPTSLGTQVGLAGADYLPAAGRHVYTWGATDQAIVLRTALQGLCLNTANATGAWSIAYRIKWSEI
jgi:hypothetical protein